MSKTKTISKERFTYLRGRSVAHEFESVLYAHPSFACYVSHPRAVFSGEEGDEGFSSFHAETLQEAEAEEVTTFIQSLRFSGRRLSHEQVFVKRGGKWSVYAVPLEVLQLDENGVPLPLGESAEA